MGAFDSFEDIEAWKKSRLLLKSVYEITKRNDFYKDRPMRDQIRSAALSAMNNIAEGNDRDGNKEFVQFLSIARGSAGEVRSMLYAARDQGYINNDEFDSLFNVTNEISKMTRSLMDYLKQTGIRGHKYKK